ncbi:MAG: hypothetical protein UY56_C0005G0045 [Parcubacteria group bacterium GW2011_GWA1_50_14]|uniref:Uncharacterized protein n=1 Tax=Candidatus Liptonbacteria bacterium GWB1_49_6 TaxID=1798644 RepID=A0A1G2C5Q8_9BACT|nr:MAG: hypothetical protein UY56_C0005G0045 [Parcubacteria group bacterium GW2011_GWA1_50_14]OGY96481.1 MAG: hypothetical protein A2122_02175 [Candidatus Liptonbacteria bacterium GWB1_49_6]
MQKAEKYIVIATAIALVILFLVQADKLKPPGVGGGFYHIIQDGDKVFGFRGNLVLQTTFYSLSILIAGVALTYWIRKKD